MPVVIGDGGARVMVVTVRAVPQTIMTPAVVVVLVSVVLVVRAGRVGGRGVSGSGTGAADEW